MVGKKIKCKSKGNIKGNIKGVGQRFPTHIYLLS